MSGESAKPPQASSEPSQPQSQSQAHSLSSQPPPLSAGGEEQTHGGLRELKPRAPGAHSNTETSAQVRQKAKAQAKAQSHSHSQAQSQPPQSSAPSASEVPLVATSPPVESTRQEKELPPEYTPPPLKGDSAPINPRDYIPPSFRHTLATTSLGAIVPQLGSIIIARSNESIATVFKKLIDYKYAPKNSTPSL